MFKKYLIQKTQIRDGIIFGKKNEKSLKKGGGGYYSFSSSIPASISFRFIPWD